MSGTGDPPTKRDPSTREPEAAAHGEVRERVKHGAGEAQQAVGEPIDQPGGTGATDVPDVSDEVADGEARR